MPSVTSCTLIQDEIATEFTLDRQRSYSLKFNVKTDGPMGPISAGLGAILASPDPLPDIWGTYSCLGDTDSDAYCNKVALRRLDPKLFVATCSFATLGRGRDPGEAAVDPFTRPPRYRGGKIVRTRAVTKDNEGKPLTTSANEEFDETIEEDVVYAVLIATRAIASLDQWIIDMSTYLGSVNSTPYRTLPARNWWCADIDVSDVIYEQGVSYYLETWQLAMNLDTWDEPMLDRGWKILDGEPPNQKQINATDDDGKNLTAPILLDGSGKKLAIDEDPVALHFRIKREVSWAGLPV